MMDLMQIFVIGLNVIGAATILFRIVAPLTEQTWDNKVLNVLNSILGAVSLNRNSNEVKIKLDKK